MKHFFTFILVAMLGFAVQAQVPQWQSVGNICTATDINGNTVNIADTLLSGKCVVIHYFATWNSWDWVVQSNGIDDSIYYQLGDSVCLLMIEADASTTMSEIMGSGASQGDWTHSGTVPYPIIDNYNCTGIVGSITAFPTIVFVSPNGYWCELYGTEWGFGPYDASSAVSAVRGLLNSYPQANHAPTVNITGTAITMQNYAVTLTANVVSVDVVQSYTWSVDGGTILSGNNTSAVTVSWPTAGTKNVSVTVTNTGSDNVTRSATAYYQVNVLEPWNWGDTISYCGLNDFESSIGIGGTGEISWGIRVPAVYMEGRDYLSAAQAYINSPGNYELLVYNPAAGTAPTTAIYQHTYSVDTSYAWVDFPIYDLLSLVDTNDLWIVLHTNGVSYPATYTQSVGDTNSSLVFYNNSWIALQTVAPSFEVTWMINAVTTNTPPPMAVMIDGPQSVFVNNAVTFSAVGPSSASYSWTLLGATPATATGQSVNATWSATGTYNVTVTATLGGQTATASMAVSVVECTTNSLPFTFGGEPNDDFICSTVIDSDNDGYSWVPLSSFANSPANYVHSGIDAIASASYINSVGALYPDNWFVLPALHIPDSGAFITWWDRALDQSYTNEYYSVMLSTTGTATSDFTTTLWSGYSTSSWRECTANIPNITNQDVYIAFRHYNTTDEYWLIIDDISVTAGSAAGDTTGTGDTNTVWNWGDTISYCEDNVFSSSVGVGNTTSPVYWGIRIPAAHMTGRNYLTDVQIYIPQGCGGNYTLNVYQGGTTAPQTLIYTSSYSFTTGLDDYVSCNLPGGVSLGSTPQDLWIVFSNTDVNYPAAGCSYVGDPNSDFISIDCQTWGHVYSDYDLDFTWMIRAVTTSSTPTLGVTIQGPSSVAAGSPATFTANSASGASYNWNLQGATPATATGQTVNATWNTVGSYTVTVTATLNGQTATATHNIDVNDCSTNQLPFSFGAETGDLLDCVSYIDNDNDGYGWMLISSLIQENASNYVHSGNDALTSASYINGVGALTPDNWVIMPRVHIPAGGATLTWWDKGLDSNYADEYYSVMISTSGTSVSDFSTTLWNGISTGSWRQCSANITGVDNQDVYIAFRHHNVTDMYFLIIDDITVTSGTALAVTINGPATVATGQMTSFSAEGSATATYSWTFQDAVPPTATGQTANAIWNTAGDYLVTVTASLDGDTATDAMTVHVMDQDNTVLTYVYGDFLGNVGTGTEVSWAVRFPSEMLAGRDSLTGVSAYIAESGAYDLYVYQGGVNVPDTVVYSGSHTVADTGWHDFNLGNSLAIDQTQSLWLILHTTDINFPIAVTEFNGDTNSCLIDFGSGVYVAPFLTDANGNEFYVSWMIKGYTTGASSQANVSMICNGSGEGYIISEMTTMENLCGTTTQYALGTELNYIIIPLPGSALAQVFVNQTDVTHQMDSMDVMGMTTYMLTVTADSNLVIVATFADVEAIYTITVESNDATMGTVSGGGEFNFGDEAVISATPYTGYRFEGWNDGNTDNPRSVIVIGDATYIANFTSETAIGETESAAVTVTAALGVIIVRGAEGKTVRIYDALGRQLLAVDNAKDEVRFHAPAAGVYIVQTNATQAHRVVVR